MQSCWMTQHQPVCFAHLGKYGDIMILLPGLKAIFDATGIRPVCIVSEQFASIFDGVSYAHPWSVRLGWYSDVDIACSLGTLRYGHCIVPKWWDCKGATCPVKLDNGPLVSLKIHGKSIQVPWLEWDSYQSSQWRASGFTLQQMMDWPLLFDRRSAEREADLRARTFHSERPKLLFNLSTSGTSPFVYVPEILPMLYQSGCEVVDLSQVRAVRIYDLLGLYDHAIGLVTSDTSTLHLAAASSVPYVAFVNNGGSGSIPKGNCVLKVRYRDTMKSRSKIQEAIKGFGYEYSLRQEKEENEIQNNHSPSQRRVGFGGSALQAQNGGALNSVRSF